jgi:hypothetical protein
MKPRQAIRCRQRYTLGKGNAHEEELNRGCSGSTELAIVVSSRSWREISLWKTRQMKKLTRFHEHLSQSRSHASQSS